MARYALCMPRRSCDAFCRYCILTGYYCGSTGLTQPSGPCTAGYYCTGGAVVANPLTSGGTVCPQGYYCPQGTAEPEPCPRGRFNPSTQKSNLTDCLPCSPGMFCNSTGGVAPTGPCFQGFYCADGSDTPSPMFSYLTSSVGGLCPPGYYCGPGVSSPSQCDPGTYMNVSGAAVCAPCPARFDCPVSGMLVPQPCPAGHYCDGTSRIPCPLGTFSNVTQVRFVAACVLCMDMYALPESIRQAYERMHTDGLYSMVSHLL